MNITQLLESGQFNDAIHEFIQTYQKVNCVMLIPVDDTHITVQLPVTNSVNKKDVCRYDFILSDPESNKILRHGFMQFASRFIRNYAFSEGNLTIEIQPNLIIRFIGS